MKYYICENLNFKKTITMKKVFAILAVAGLMTACNNAAAPEVKADSTAKVDTTKK